MKKSRFSEEQIIGILEEQQAGLPVAEVNLHRPHMSLGGLTPNEFAAQSQQDQKQNGLW